MDIKTQHWQGQEDGVFADEKYSNFGVLSSGWNPFGDISSLFKPRFPIDVQLVSREETSEQAISRLQARIAQYEDYKSKDPAFSKQYQEVIDNAKSSLTDVLNGGTSFEQKQKKAKAEKEASDAQAKLDALNQLQYDKDSAERKSAIAKAEADLIEAEAKKAVAQTQAKIEEDKLKAQDLDLKLKQDAIKQQQQEADAKIRLQQEDADSKKKMQYVLVGGALLVAFLLFRNK
jgi:hypothetical protein